eukprot:jgi/Mesen1/1426/ME001303S00480
MGSPLELSQGQTGDADILEKPKRPGEGTRSGQRRGAATTQRKRDPRRGGQVAVARVISHGNQTRRTCMIKPVASGRHAASDGIKSKQPGPITRLLSCTEENLKSYTNMDLAPTHVVPSLSRHPISGDMYTAINKPAGVVHWVENSPDAQEVEWVPLPSDANLAPPAARHSPPVLNTDALSAVPPAPGPGPLAVTCRLPPGRYLIGCDNVLAQLHTKHPELCDKVGGFIVMHIDDVRKFAPLWLSKTEEVRADRAHYATNITGDIYGEGWISEMYGYSFGAADVAQGSEGQMRADHLSIECVNTINEGLLIHHATHGCPKPLPSPYVNYLKANINKVLGPFSQVVANYTPLASAVTARDLETARSAARFAAAHSRQEGAALKALIGGKTAQLRGETVQLATLRATGKPASATRQRELPPASEDSAQEGTARLLGEAENREANQGAGADADAGAGAGVHVELGKASSPRLPLLGTRFPPPMSPPEDGGDVAGAGAADVVSQQKRQPQPESLDQTLSATPAAPAVVVSVKREPPAEEDEQRRAPARRAPQVAGLSGGGGSGDSGGDRATYDAASWQPRPSPPGLPRIVTLFSAECSSYFDWQTLGLAYSFRRSGQPGPLTRLLSCSEAALQEYGGMELAPTMVVPSWNTHPVTGDWYPAINKPVAINHWLNHSKEAQEVDYVVILDADMILRRPLTPWDLGAAPGRPVAAPYGYLIGCDNELGRLHMKDPTVCDKVGGFIVMHIDDLRKFAPLWLSKTEEVRADKEHYATNITGDVYGKGWISEMYGYSFGASDVSGPSAAFAAAATCRNDLRARGVPRRGHVSLPPRSQRVAWAGLKHKADDDAMLYPGYVPREGVDPRVLHYGVHFQVLDWSFNKAAWRLVELASACGKHFPDPPDPAALPLAATGGGGSGERRRDLISIECVAVLNRALREHHRRIKCQLDGERDVGTMDLGDASTTSGSEEHPVAEVAVAAFVAATDVERRNMVKVQAQAQGQGQGQEGEEEGEGAEKTASGGADEEEDGGAGESTLKSTSLERTVDGANGQSEGGKGAQGHVSLGGLEKVEAGDSQEETEPVEKAAVAAAEGETDEDPPEKDATLAEVVDAEVTNQEETNATSVQIGAIGEAWLERGSPREGAVKLGRQSAELAGGLLPKLHVEHPQWYQMVPWLALVGAVVFLLSRFVKKGKKHKPYALRSSVRGKSKLGKVTRLSATNGKAESPSWMAANGDGLAKDTDV